VMTEAEATASSSNWLRRTPSVPPRTRSSFSGSRNRSLRSGPPPSPPAASLVYPSPPSRHCPSCNLPSLRPCPCVVSCSDFCLHLV
jgi:hypothetical protein